MTRRSIATLSGVAVAVVAFAACVPPGRGSWGPVTGNDPAPTQEVDPCVLDPECNPWLDPPFDVVLPVPVNEDPRFTGYLPCDEEDSPGPCYWNAATFGNGVGHSFIVEADQTVRYVS